MLRFYNWLFYNVLKSMLFCIVLLFNYLQTFYPFKPIAKYTIPYILPIPACVAGYSTFNAYHQHFLIMW